MMLIRLSVDCSFVQKLQYQGSGHQRQECYLIHFFPLFLCTCMYFPSSLHESTRCHWLIDWLTDWQTDRQTCWWIDWLIHCITFHRPVINSSFCDKSKGVDINPLPESDILHHGMCLHLAFHFNVKDLKSSSSWKWKGKQSPWDRARNNFPAGAGQVVRSNLLLLAKEMILAGKMLNVKEVHLASFHCRSSSNSVQKVPNTQHNRNVQLNWYNYTFASHYLFLSLLLFNFYLSLSDSCKLSRYF